MNVTKRGQQIAVVAGMVIVAALGFNITNVYAHGHGGGHHSEHTHVHFTPSGHHGQQPGGTTSSVYTHSHDDYGKHHHDCRTIPGIKTDGETSEANPYNEECQNHNGEWEPSSGN